MTDETVPMSVRFPAETHEALRRMAYETRESINTIVVRGAQREVAEHLDRHDPDSESETDR